MQNLALFLAIFIDDKGSLEGYDLQNGSFIQKNSKASDSDLMLFSYTAQGRNPKWRLHMGKNKGIRKQILMSSFMFKFYWYY
ncbi:hypothetical protein SAMN05216191_11950 [Paenibacillus jilunlii]|uniref:Uncharacterized protein n=1 Tax=Paenibacillus jilunlii TaxID=682956 RepID=A0A1G9WG45_9BACL|nr:hypothetical protein AML91_17670 [Paenibacillus jilunlii]SDM83181.1 hypothetical protein SAMN05216191_11950 [Paenibacillus jilunlii]